MVSGQNREGEMRITLLSYDHIINLGYKISPGTCIDILVGHGMSMLLHISSISERNAQSFGVVIFINVTVMMSADFSSALGRAILLDISLPALVVEGSEVLHS